MLDLVNLLGRERALSSVTRLHLNYAGLGDDGAATLAVLVLCTPMLHALDVSFNGIGHDGITKLCASLRRAPGLAELNVSRNPLTKGGVWDVASVVIAGARSLHCLYMSNCGVGDDGFKVIGAAVGSSKAMRELDMRDNRPSGAGIIAVAAAAAACPTMTLDDAGGVVQCHRGRRGVHGASGRRRGVADTRDRRRRGTRGGDGRERRGHWRRRGVVAVDAEAVSRLFRRHR
jgi:hypothetical protein